MLARMTDLVCISRIQLLLGHIADALQTAGDQRMRKMKGRAVVCAHLTENLFFIVYHE